jgi:hypothetical protein
MFEMNNFEAIGISLASPEKILEWSADESFELFEKYNSIFNPGEIYIKNPYNWLMEYVLLETGRYCSSVSPQIFDQIITRLTINSDCTRFLTYMIIHIS